MRPSAAACCAARARTAPATRSWLRSHLVLPLSRALSPEPRDAAGRRRPDLPTQEQDHDQANPHLTSLTDGDRRGRRPGERGGQRRRAAAPATWVQDMTALDDTIVWVQGRRLMQRSPDGTIARVAGRRTRRTARSTSAHRVRRDRADLPALRPSVPCKASSDDLEGRHAELQATRAGALPRHRGAGALACARRLRHELLQAQRPLRRGPLGDLRPPRRRRTEAPATTVDGRAGVALRSRDRRPAREHRRGARRRATTASPSRSRRPSTARTGDRRRSPAAATRPATSTAASRSARAERSGPSSTASTPATRTR